MKVEKWSHLRIPVALVFCLALATIGYLAAKDGRDFAGFYDISETTDLGEQMKVTLTIRVFNYSGADVFGTKITLEDSLLTGEALGSFAALVDIKGKESVKVNDIFYVPQREYDQWQEGGTPRLRVDYKDSAGKDIRRPIELVPMLIPEEK